MSLLAIPRSFQALAYGFANPPDARQNPINCDYPWNADEASEGARFRESVEHIYPALNCEGVVPVTFRNARVNALWS